MTDCLFCSIAEGAVPAEVIYNDEHAVAFLDVHPLTRGHTLVVPRTHAENIAVLPDELVGPVFSAVARVTRMLEKALSPQGFTIGINHGRISGQTIDHLHIHIIPRYEGDGGGNVHSIVSNPPEESVEKTGEVIRNASR